MQECSHLFDECSIQTFGDPIQCWGVMDGESAHSASGCEVLIEFLAQVLSPSIGTQDLDGMAVVLCVHPRLEPQVG
jgi:hypothetical protein